ncbi:MAG TPA: MFS transporter, partial [Chthonomonadales bacterium]|nr:MFS transporter [Chthonomonadales bacterium]
MSSTAEAASETRAHRPPDLSRLDALRGMRISTWEAGYSTVWSALTSGAFLTGFALWLGAGSVALGLLAAAPTLAGLIQIPSSYLSDRHRERRRFTAWFSLAARILWLPILALPFALKHPLWPVLILFTLSYALLNIPQPAFLSWLSDLVPASHRGRFFARRNMVAGLVGLVVTLPAAWFLDVTTHRAHQPAMGFATLFGLAVAGGVLSFACLLRQPEPHKSAVSTVAEGAAGVLEYYRAPFADRNFRRLLSFSALFACGQFFAAPFFNVYGLQNLRLNYMWLQIFNAITTLTSLAAFPMWGYLSDRLGNKPLLVLCVCGVFTLPLTWALTTPAHPTAALLLLTELNLVGGVFWAGANLTQFNLLISMSP